MVFRILFSCIFCIFLCIYLNCGSSVSKKNGQTGKYGLSNEQYEYVKIETVPDGKLDFEKKLGDKLLFLIDGVAYNKKDAALFTWGQAIKQLGVANSEDAISLYEEIKNIKLKEPQVRAIINGFNYEGKQ